MLCQLLLIITSLHGSYTLLQGIQQASPHINISTFHSCNQNNKTSGHNNNSLLGVYILINTSWELMVSIVCLFDLNVYSFLIMCTASEVLGSPLQVINVKDSTCILDSTSAQGTAYKFWCGMEGIERSLGSKLNCQFSQVLVLKQCQSKSLLDAYEHNDQFNSMYIAQCALHCYNGSSYSITSEDYIYHDSFIWSEYKPLPNTSEGLCTRFFQNQRQRHEQLYIHTWCFCTTLLFYAYFIDVQSKRTLSRQSQRTPSKLA